MNKVAINVAIMIFHVHIFSFLLSRCLKGIPGHRVGIFFIKLPNSLPKWLYHLVSPLATNTSCRSSISLLTLDILSLSKYVAILVGERWYLMVLICISLVNNEMFLQNLHGIYMIKTVLCLY